MAASFTSRNSSVSRSYTHIGWGLAANIRRKLASRCRSVSAACRSSVVSWETTTAAAPSSPVRMADADSCSQRRPAPSLSMDTDACTWSRVASRVDSHPTGRMAPASDASSMFENSGVPTTSSAVLPVMRSMAWFHSRTRPSASVDRMPSEEWCRIRLSSARSLPMAWNRRALWRAALTWLANVVNTCSSRPRTRTAPRKPTRNVPRHDCCVSSGPTRHMAMPRDWSSSAWGAGADAATIWNGSRSHSTRGQNGPAIGSVS